MIKIKKIIYFIIFCFYFIPIFSFNLKLNNINIENTINSLTKKNITILSFPIILFFISYFYYNNENTFFQNLLYFNKYVPIFICGYLATLTFYIYFLYIDIMYNLNIKDSNYILCCFIIFLISILLTSRLYKNYAKNTISKLILPENLKIKDPKLNTINLIEENTETDKILKLIENNNIPKIYQIINIYYPEIDEQQCFANLPIYMIRQDEKKKFELLYYFYFYININLRYDSFTTETRLFKGEIKDGPGWNDYLEKHNKSLLKILNIIITKVNSINTLMKEKN
jgi:hypothetical protein